MVVKQISASRSPRASDLKPKVEPSFQGFHHLGIYGYWWVRWSALDSTLAERLVDKLLGGKSPQEKKIMFVDTLGELANMITGNATSLLNSSKDAALKITTPAIATGTNLSINLVPKPALVLGLYTQYGPIEISIAVEEQDALSEVRDPESVLSEV
jgi:CheY-specific phosphatase CheX